MKIIAANRRYKINFFISFLRENCEEDKKNISNKIFNIYIKVVKRGSKLKIL